MKKHQNINNPKLIFNGEGYNFIILTSSLEDIFFKYFEKRPKK
jgi:hypothetical protein